MLRERYKIDDEFWADVGELRDKLLIASGLTVCCSSTDECRYTAAAAIWLLRHAVYGLKKNPDLDDELVVWTRGVLVSFMGETLGLEIDKETMRFTLLDKLQ